jgi:signal transduction histidine kinase
MSSETNASSASAGQEAGAGLEASAGQEAGAGLEASAGQEAGASPAEMRALRELCHDLTMSAASIKLLAHVAATEPDLDRSMRIRLRQIADEAGKIAEICGYVVDQSPDPRPTGLDILADDVADGVRLQYLGVIEVAAEAVTVAAHPVVVTRILTNLLDNACRAAGPRGRVRLAVQRDGDQARLVVADSGRGFGHAKAGKASLGLEIVAALVRRSGGTLQMGTGELGGLAVTVTLPGANGRRSSAAGGPAWREEAG